jgi:hypothetical protein
MQLGVSVQIPISAFSQEKSGIALSNFGGINAAHLNPSSLVHSKIFYDVNLVSANFFVENNFLYIHQEDFNLSAFLKRNPDLPSLETPGQGVDYNRNVESINAFEQTDVYGPSFSIHLGDHAVGVFSRVVTMTSIDNMSAYLGTLLFEGLSYDTMYGIPQNNGRLETSVAGWWELGLSYAYMFKKQRRNQWSFGVNLRRLFGFAGVSVVSDNAQYTLIDEETLDIENLDAEIRYSLPIDYTTNDYPAPGRTFKGRGTAIDLGFTFRKNRDLPNTRNRKSFCEYDFEDYLYKIGISILDLGGLKFTENAVQHDYDKVSVLWQEMDTLEYRNINDMAATLSTVFYGDPNASKANTDHITIGMPAALSLQADYNYFGNWHVAGYMVLPLKLAAHQINRPGQALVSLRYETNYFEVALPVSLYDFEKPRIGLSARLLYFTVGTEKLGGLFGFNDFYGMDIYFSVKFHILKGWCGRYKPASDCSNFDY